jgi:gamma-glutamyltranspeptidase/glutathione hydrolase
MMFKHGGLITKSELENYSVQPREPIKIDYKEFEIFTNPPPSSGGILIAFTLKLLENMPLNNYNSKIELMHLLEAMVVSNEFRSEKVNEYLHESGLKNILKDERLIAGYQKTHKSRLNLWGNTTHVSVIDKHGNCASATTTNGEGSGFVVPECGIVLNNMLGEEDLNPHGFFKWPSYVRLPSMMSPTVVKEAGKNRLALGSAGSNRIRSAMVQVMINYLIYGKNIQKSISAPRVHFENDTIFCEPGINSGFLQEAEKLYKVNKFDELSLFFGGVQAVTGYKDGGADPRRDGAVIVIK